MPAGWSQFKANISGYMNGRGAPSESAAANFIANAYEQAVLAAEDMTKNKLISYNKQGFIQQLHQGFVQSKTITGAVGSADLVIKPFIDMAAVLFWTGAMMTSSYKGMPPGHTGFIPPNMITSPGICNYVPPNPAVNLGSSSPFADALANCFRLHLLTISGLHTLVTLPSPAPPYPFAWVGIT